MSTDTSKFFVTRPPRPMLARDADSVYWMSRYAERAEHIARILLVNTNLLIDVGDLAPELQERQWQSVLTIMRSAELPQLPPDPPALTAMPGTTTDAPLAQRVAHHMAFSSDNPNSLFNCISRARENARGIRETISAEMWENLNTLYWTLRDAPARFDESPEDVYRQVIIGSMLFQGLTDQTLQHDQRWHFAQLGKHLERIDVTSRVIATRFQILKQAESKLETPIRNIHWMSVLRSCCSIEAYRRNNIGDMDPVRVASFLILEPEFPRSIRFCVGQAYAAIAAIRAELHPQAIDPAERALGRLKTQLDYAEPAEVLKPGVPQYCERIQHEIAEAAVAVQATYFLH
ncbi:MAG TPA: alpha-E domain-containing protein [Tepidisphaeraceae bacterium]|nr:alpha-E domain-containing protein [Tepidisphaeraceae bacterium]